MSKKTNTNIYLSINGKLESFSSKVDALETILLYVMSEAKEGQLPNIEVDVPNQTGSFEVSQVIYNAVQEALEKAYKTPKDGMFEFLSEIISNNPLISPVSGSPASAPLPTPSAGSSKNKARHALGENPAFA